MIDLFIARLKNIMFFKGVLYTLAIFVIAWILPGLQDELANMTSSLQDTKYQLLEAKDKIHSLETQGDQVIATYKKYQTLSQNSVVTDCDNRLDFVKGLRRVEQKFGLHTPIQAKIRRSFDDLGILHLKNEDMLKHYHITMQFRTNSMQQFFSVIKEIYTLTPKNSVIVACNAKQETALDPELISNLSQAAAPESVTGNLDIRISEVSLPKE